MAVFCGTESIVMARRLGVSLNANICVLCVSTQPLKTRFYTQTNHISIFVVTSLLWYTSYMTDVIDNEISANV